MEAGLVELNTGRCVAWSVRARLATPLARGDHLSLDLARGELMAPSPAERRLIVRVDGGRSGAGSAPSRRPARPPRSC